MIFERSLVLFVTDKIHFSFCYFSNSTIIRFKERPFATPYVIYARFQLI